MKTGTKRIYALPPGLAALAMIIRAPKAMAKSYRRSGAKAVQARRAGDQVRGT